MLNKKNTIGWALLLNLVTVVLFLYLLDPKIVS